MYVILVNDDNTLSAPKKQRIMQRSKLVDTLFFLVNPIYNEYDMTDCTVSLEFLLPVSKKYCNEILTLSEERYEEYLKYTLPVDTNLTSEAGKIELQLTFAYVDFDDDGNVIQRVRKTSTIFINVIPISAWSDIIPDSALSALDQRIIKTDAQIKALNNITNVLSESKADNLKYEDNELQLMSGTKEIGNKVTIKQCNNNCEEGVPAVDFSNISGDNSDNTDIDIPSKDDDRDVVEFYEERDIVEF